METRHLLPQWELELTHYSLRIAERFQRQQQSVLLYRQQQKAVMKELLYQYLVVQRPTVHWKLGRMADD